MSATHQVIAGPYAGRDCWVTHEYPGGEWADVQLLPLRPWVFPETGCVRINNLRRIDVYERSLQLGEALL